MVDMTREPSMEEILSSIRRVIARDEGRRDAFAAALDADDVLDLNDVHVASNGVVQTGNAAVAGMQCHKRQTCLRTPPLMMPYCRKFRRVPRANR